MLMYCLRIAPRITCMTVSPKGFAPFKFVDVAVNAHEENVESRQKMYQSLHPYPRFDNVLDDQVVSSPVIGRECQMKACRRRRFPSTGWASSSVYGQDTPPAPPPTPPRGGNRSARCPV
jgi:hypothetical protein